MKSAMKRLKYLKPRKGPKKIITGALLLIASMAVSVGAIWTKTNDSNAPALQVVATSRTFPTPTPPTSPLQTSPPPTSPPIPYEVGPYTPPLSCGVGQLNPAEYESKYVSAGCVAGWMFTWSDTCIECEGLLIWRASEGYWTVDDFYGSYLYTYCYDLNNQFGQSQESDTYYSLQLIFTTFDCNGEELKYRQEPAGGPLKFGDIGKRVKALQKALIEQAYLVDFDEIGKADGIYGPLTIRAVMNFQYMSGLPTTGIADKRTFAELGLKFSHEKN